LNKQAPETLRIGQAGVYQVSSQLLLRGFNPMFAAVDHGTDLFVEGGIRVQVKTGGLRQTSKTTYPNGAYWFKLTKQKMEKDRRVTVKEFDWTETCDFVVFWGINENRFWIVPSQLLNGHQLLVVGASISQVGHHIDLDVQRISEMHASGMRQEDIAVAMGVQQMTISRRLRGLFLDNQRPFFKQVRECEGRWEFFEEYLAAIRSADSAISASPLASPKNQSGGIKEGNYYA
jgi:hypothetical protein